MELIEILVTSQVIFVTVLGGIGLKSHSKMSSDGNMWSYTNWPSLHRSKGALTRTFIEILRQLSLFKWLGNAVFTLSTLTKGNESNLI